ncbi:MAG: hypothetical protein ACOCM4_08585 [Acetivibrio ethanolgignens]
MLEKELTDSQKERIDKLREEMKREIAAIPEKKGPYNVLDGGRSEPYTTILEHYQRMIREIEEE